MESIGVLDKTYSDKRKRKPELKFRLKVRAQTVARAVKKYYLGTTDLDILDLGAAEGKTLFELDKMIPGNNYLGIEYSESLINDAPPLPKNINLVQGDVTKLPKNIASESIDVVSALAVLEHLPSPVEALKESFRVLKKGGILIASSPSPFWDHISGKLGLLKDDQHEVEMTKKFFKEIFIEAEFELVSYKRFMWAPVSFLPYFHIPVGAKFSLFVDQIISKLFIFNFLFVNQTVIARKTK